MAATRILHLSDLHWEPGGQRPAIEHELQLLTTTVRSLDPDFLLVSGDLTTRGGRRIGDLRDVKRWLETFDIPYLAVAGNHDLGANAARGASNPDMEHYEPVPFAQTNFGQVFGPQPVHTVDLGPLAIVGFSIRSQDPDGVLETLQRLFVTLTKPVVLSGHYPLAPVRSGGPAGNEPFGTSAYIQDLVLPLERFIRNHVNIRVYAAGHVHIASTTRMDPKAAVPCWQITAGGLGPGASALRLYTVSGHVLRYSTVLGPGALDFWGRYQPQWGPFPETYHLGEAEERSGEIAL